MGELRDLALSLDAYSILVVDEGLEGLFFRVFAEAHLYLMQFAIYEEAVPVSLKSCPHEAGFAIEETTQTDIAYDEIYTGTEEPEGDYNNAISCYSANQSGSGIE